FVELERRVVELFVADGGGKLATGDPASRGPGEVPRVDLHMVGEGAQARYGLLKEDGRANPPVLRQVRSGEITHQKKVGGEETPGLRTPTQVPDQEVNLFRAVARHVQDFHFHLAQSELLPVFEP